MGVPTFIIYIATRYLLFFSRSLLVGVFVCAVHVWSLVVVVVSVCPREMFGGQ